MTKVEIRNSDVIKLNAGDDKEQPHFPRFLEPRPSEAVFGLRNSFLDLAVSFVITNLSAAFPSMFS